MKLKKVLASILALTMVLSTMSFTVFADVADTDIYKIGEGQAYASLEEARAAATDADGDGAITYEIHGRVSTGYNNNESIGILPSDIKGITTINIVGADETAELYIPTAERAALDGGFNSTNGINVNVNNLICARPNGQWADNFADGNNHFILWTSVGATLTYTDCSFPNGVASNIKGTTIFNDCEFDCQLGDRTKQQYALWAFASTIGATEVQVNGGSFSGSKGVKVYVDNHTAEHGADDVITIEGATFNIVDEPALVSSSYGTIALNDNEYTDNGNGVIATTGQSDLTIDGEEPLFIASAPDKWGSVYYTQSVSYAKVLLDEAIDNGFVSNPELITYVAEVDGTYYTSLTDALKAITAENNVFNLLADVTVDYAWDNRTYGTNPCYGRFEFPVTINGNGHTLKFTDVVNDNGNYTSAFRFGADANLYDLTIDMSEAKTTVGLNWPNPGKLRAISSGVGDLTVENCTFIGNPEYKTTCAVIFGEGGYADVDAKIVNCTFKDWTRGVSDNQNANDVETVVITGSTFDNAGINISASDSVVLTDNVVEDAYVIITSYSATNELSVVATGNTLEAAADGYANKINASEIIAQDDFVYASAAKIGDVIYSTIQAAVDAAVDDDTVVILPGTYDESFMVTQKKDVDVTITAENKGDVTLTGTIYVNGQNNYYNAETLTISNLVFEGSEKTTAHKFIYDYNTNTDSNRTYSHNVTVTNCDFTGNGSFEDETAVQGIYCRQGANYTITGCTATNMHSLLWVSNVDGLEISGCTITNCESVTTITSSPALTFTNNVVDVEKFAVRTGQGNASTNTVATITMTGNTIEAGETALVMRNATTTATMTGNSIIAPTAYSAENADASTINGVALTAEGIEDAVNSVNVVIPDALNISFEQVEAGLYNIVLDGEDDIYEFVAAELTFANTSATVAGEYMNYEVYGIDGATNAEKSIEKADTYALRLVDGAGRMSGRDIVIGQVKFFGQGDINFTVSEGKVVTTEYGTNLPQYYTVDADETTTDTLKVDGIVNGAVTEVTRDVVVNVNYNLALDGSYWTDNQITVTVKDGFGNVYDAEDLTNGVATIEDVKLGRLTVTLEAPGFRRYVYNTTLETGADENDALVLNFWNEVKRDTVQSPLAEIETGKGTMAHNFLVGDIVMDYTVDEYDLAAVTSYYGTYSIAQADAEKYIKYDLNRDGNIDIIDVHYVLHTYDN